MLHARAVGYSHGAVAALDDVSFDIKPGRVTMLLGPNGAGKTTLFSLIVKLLPLRRGTISIDGQDLAMAGYDILARIGIVFQQQSLDLNLSVEQNLAYHAALHGLPRAAAAGCIQDALARLDLEARRRDKVRTLNGGHRRRVEIARALMTAPRLLLLDEPTAGLDIPARRALVDFLHDLARSQQLAILWATHLSDEVRDDDDIVVLARGCVRACGRAADVVASSGAASLDGAFARLTAERIDS